MDTSVSAREPWEVVSEVLWRDDRHELHQFREAPSPGETARTPVGHRSLAVVMLLGAVCACSNGPAPAGETPPETATVEHARDIDAANFTAERNYTMNLPIQVTLSKMETGGLDVAWFVVYVGQGALTNAGYANARAQALEKFDAIHWLTEKIAPGRIALAVPAGGGEFLVRAAGFTTFDTSMSAMGAA